MERRVYTESGEELKFWNTMKSVVAQLPESLSLGYRLALRNIKAKYRQSIFGLLWAFLPPLATALVWILLRSTSVVNFESDIPYPAFVLTGTLLWQLFAQSVTIPISSVNANRSILTKVNIPKEALVFNAFFEIAFNALISLVILAIVFFAYGGNVSWTLALFPVGMLILILIGLAIGVLILPVGLLFKDIGYGLPLIMQLFMYLTPVVYPAPESYKGMAKILEYNPLTPVITSTRKWLFAQSDSSDLALVMGIGGIALIFVFLGVFIQRISISILIERMGS